MLLDDNVVTKREAKACPFAGWLRGKERIEYFLFYPGRNAAAVVANADLDTVTQVAGRGSNGWFVAVIRGPFAFLRRVDAIRNQVKKDARNLLRKRIDHPSGRIKRPFQLNVEALLFSSGTMVGQTEAVLNKGVEVDRSAFSRTLTRV